MGALREQVQARTAAIQSQSKEAIDAEAHSRQEALGLLHTQVTSAAEAQREVVGTLREQVIGFGRRQRNNLVWVADHGSVQRPNHSG